MPDWVKALIAIAALFVVAVAPHAGTPSGSGFSDLDVDPTDDQD